MTFIGVSRGDDMCTGTGTGGTPTGSVDECCDRNNN